MKQQIKEYINLIKLERFDKISPNLITELANEVERLDSFMVRELGTKPIATNKLVTFSIAPIIGFGFIKSNATMIGLVKFKSKIFTIGFLVFTFTTVYEYIN